MRQWVISVPKRLRGMLADRPRAVTALANGNIGESARGPTTDWARVQPHVLAHDPDLLIVEFAVNDFDNRDFAKSYEGLLRHILAARLETAVFFSVDGSEPGEPAFSVRITLLDRDVPSSPQLPMS